MIFFILPNIAGSRNSEISSDVPVPMEMITEIIRMNAALAADPKYSGTTPQTVVRVVSTMGRNRERTAFLTDLPFLYDSTTRMALLTASPEEMMIPKMTVVLIEFPDSRIYSRTTDADRGITPMTIIRGKVTDSNCAASTAKIRNTVIPKTR